MYNTVLVFTVVIYRLLRRYLHIHKTNKKCAAGAKKNNTRAETIVVSGSVIEKIHRCVELSDG